MLFVGGSLDNIERIEKRNHCWWCRSIGTFGSNSLEVAVCYRETLWNYGIPSFREDTTLHLFPSLHSSLRTYRQISLEVVEVSFLVVENVHFHLPFLLGSSSFTNMKATRLSIVTDTRTYSVIISSRV